MDGAADPLALYAEDDERCLVRALAGTARMLPPRIERSGRGAGGDFTRTDSELAALVKLREDMVAHGRWLAGEGGEAVRRRKKKARDSRPSCKSSNKPMPACVAVL